MKRTRTTPTPTTPANSERSLARDWRRALPFVTHIDELTLRRGLLAAARGEVGPVDIEPATARAVVCGGGTVERRVRLGFRRHSADQIDALRSIFSESSRTLAAVLAGDLPPAVHDRLVEQRCGLLPEPGEMSIDCSCGDHSDACGHAAAVCAALTTELERDPLVALTLRGIDRVDLLASLRVAEPRGERPNSVIEVPKVAVAADSRRSALAGRLTDPGMAAGTALRRRVAELPAPTSRRPGVGQPRQPSISPPSDLGFDRAGLQRLVRDAAIRAAAVLDDGADPGLTLDVACDALRRFSLGTLAAAELAGALGCDDDDVDGLVHAWNVGGAAGLGVMRAPRRLGDDEVATVERAWGCPGRVRSTGLLFGNDVQVRRAIDGTWVLLSAERDAGWRVQAVSSEIDDLSPV